MRNKGKLRNHFDQGFTLIEMIVSITLVAMMAVGLWALLRVGIQSWARGSESVDVNQRHRSIMDLVKKQMASIYGLIAPVDIQSGVAIYPMFAGASSSMQFISLCSMRFQDNPGLTMVSYDVVQDRQGVYRLVEREAQYLGLQEGDNSPADDDSGGVTTIFENLEDFMFEYFDPGSADRPSRWVQTWNARETGLLPAAVSMTLVSRDSKGGLLNRQVVVPILAKPYDPRLNFVNPFDSRRRRLNENDPRFIR